MKPDLQNKKSKTLDKPFLKAPSRSIESQIEDQKEYDNSENKRSGSLILILIGIIICLILIILAMILTPHSSPSITEKKIKESEKNIITSSLKKSEEIINNQEIKIKSEIILEVKADEENHVDELIIKEKKEKQNKESEFKKKQALKLKNEKIDLEFKKIISDTLTALDKHQYRLASEKLKIAQSLKQSDPVTKELDERIKAEVKKTKINILMKKAYLEEKNEKWKSALSYYEKIQVIDANINSILLNIKRTNAYIKMDKILNEIINKEERLQDDKVLEKSKKSLQYIELYIEENEHLLYPIKQTPELTKKITTAEKIIKDASIIINITIRSDNLTDVSIYKVGQLGKLKEKKLNLKQGIYTIVGSREGYRDYRQNIKITAKDQYRVIIVVCRETI